MREHRDRIPGGMANKKKPSDFNPRSLREGIRVEMEHTDDPEIAREIAMDHLVEDKRYYEKLKLIHKALKVPRKKPYGHVSYVRVQGGKLVIVKQSGVKPIKLRVSDWIGKKFKGIDFLPGLTMSMVLPALGIKTRGGPILEARPDKTEFDLSGDINSHAVASSWYVSTRMKKKRDIDNEKLDYKRPRDVKEETQHLFYTPEYHKRHLRNKFSRCVGLDPKFDLAVEKVHRMLANKDLPLITREAAAMVYIIMKTGVRRGVKEHYDKSGIRGAGTISPKNVTIKGDTCELTFVGKKQSVNVVSIKDAILARFLKECKDRAKGEFVWQFPDNYHKKRVMKLAGIGDFKPHDMRTLLACRWATLEFTKTKFDLPRGDTEAAAELVYKHIIKVGHVIDKKLCEDTEGTTLKGYIDPAVVEEWIRFVGYEPEDIPKWVNFKVQNVGGGKVEKSLSADAGWLDRFGTLWSRIVALKPKPIGKTDNLLDLYDDDPVVDEEDTDE